MKTLLTLALVGLISVATVHGQDFAAATATEVPKSVATVHSDEYVIGSDDILAVNIWKEPELSRTVPVRPDGKITLPLIGEIQASGLTPKKLQDSLAAGLKAYVTNPEVTVIVQEVKSLKYNIVGEITRPGSYLLTEPTTVLSAIAVAGGLRDFAKGGHIYVLRANKEGSFLKLPFDYKQVIKGKKLSQNVELRA